MDPEHPSRHSGNVVPHSRVNGEIDPAQNSIVDTSWRALVGPSAIRTIAFGPTLCLPGGQSLMEQVFFGNPEAGTWLRMLHTHSVPRIFNAQGQLTTFAPPERPLRILVLTSIRDIAKEEHVGEVVHTPLGSHYIKGTVEALLQASSTTLGRFIELAGVVTDDLPRDLQGTPYRPLPQSCSPWIHPIDLANPEGARAPDFTFNIPSAYRALPRDAIHERAALKLAFEQEVFDVMQRCRADIILSDSFMGRIDYLISPQHFNLFGRVLNIHPGISRGDHPYACRGKDPARDALLHAKGLHRDPESDQLVEIAPYTQTGASLHLVSEHIDDGPVLCEEESVLIDPDDSEQAVSVKINLTAKPRVSMLGLAHVASHLHPAQGGPFDWGNLAPVEWGGDTL